MTARAKIEAIVFDAGGTLVRLDYEWMCETVTALGFPLEIPALRRGEVEGRRRYDASRGRPAREGEAVPPLGSQGDTLAYFGGMLDACGVPGPVAGQAVEAFLAHHAETGLWTRPVEGARAALDAARVMGLRLSVVSNSDGRAERHLVDCEVREGLEFVVDSRIVGVEKPDPRIFHIALERMDVAPEHALYVGDILCVDAAGSRAAGLHFVLLDPFGDYAPPNVMAIPGMFDLPVHLTQRFTLPASVNPEEVPAPHRTGP
ncbi:MAG: HAD family hydrolase [Candidatus Eisenbacteria bacterium]